MAWAVNTDVTGAWIGDDVPTDTAKIDVWIGKAEREIKRRVPDIQDRIDAEAAESPARTDLLDSATDVVVAMVSRVFRNPAGVRQSNTTDTAGPFSGTTSVTYGGNQPGALFLTDDEYDALNGEAGARGAFTIDLIPVTSLYYPTEA